MTIDPHAPIAEWAQALRRLYDAASEYRQPARQRGMRHVASTPLVVGRLLTELALHAATSAPH